MGMHACLYVCEIIILCVLCLCVCVWIYVRVYMCVCVFVCVRDNDEPSMMRGCSSMCTCYEGKCTLSL